ncbi:pentapeptide repeat-containing protein [Rothia mucilaginosa]|uniref:pentapeptide repeat-containing protein n=1 Tax=Rothia mucilaginosa TaxID=43675 RepID=UPI0028D05577|nr:pentapeptide repeat-containing protein [Rothia mucilaginosa]
MHLAPSTAWVWLIACAVVILLFPLAAQFGNLKGKLSSFRTWVWAIALLGIVTAGFIPFTFDTDIANFEVQPFIFFITGTLLGVLFLGEFHRMNAQKKLEHPQRVHAERRTRYSKAVEQLAYPNPAVRASAISTLAGLVDEWLADEQLSVEARQKEGQVIVNALCAYVRSPFARAFKAETFESDAPPANYAGDFATDLAAFRGEQDVRRSVFVEMSKRSSTLTENEKGEVAVIPGAWSGFEFDFSRAVVFYPLDGLTLENADFSVARFCNGSDFSGSAFVSDAKFTRAVFDQDARFSDVTFMGTADFSNARFAGDAFFRWVSFNANADFREASFGGHADFRDAAFTADAGFSGASFEGNAGFFRSSFGGNASFFRTDFAGVAEFREAVFEGHAGFNAATFYGDAHFSRATFEGLAGFRDVTFKAGAEFYGASFVQTADFCDSSFVKSPPLFAAEDVESGEVYRARFAALPTGSEPANQEAHNFAVYEGRQPIPLGTAELLNRTFVLPIGAVLYDPDSWDEEKQEYTRVSEPAQ